MPELSKQAAEIVGRLRKWREGNGPKGLPEPKTNEDRTNMDYPTAGILPTDKGYDPARCIAGTGGGPILTSAMW